MIEEKYPEAFNASLQIQYQSDLNHFQDNIYSSINHRIIPNYITLKEEEFIIKNNKYFYKEYKELYKKNIELKNKLNEIIEEKKILNDKINKFLQQNKKFIDLNNKELFNNNSNDKNDYINIIKSFIKTKRKRKKKAEIIKKYNCSFPNCDKSYPSKGSLNMHIKLKHQKIYSFNFLKDNQNKLHNFE